MFLSKKDVEERTDCIIKMLKPCLKKSRDPEWSGYRYRTAWGTKTEAGLRASIKRVLSERELPKIE